MGVVGVWRCCWAWLENGQFMIHTATITSASLRVREGRITAELLLGEVSRDEWKRAIYEQNRLQTGSLESMKRISRSFGHAGTTGPGLWEN